MSARLPSARLRRDAEAVHALGPLSMAYMLDELLAGADVERTIRAYRDLPGEFIAAYGADRDRPRLFAVGGGR